MSFWVTSPTDMGQIGEGSGGGGRRGRKGIETNEARKEGR